MCVELLSADQARAIEPHLSPDVKGALHMPLGAHTCCMCLCVRALVLYVCTCACVIFPGVLVFLLFTLLRLNVDTPTNNLFICISLPTSIPSGVSISTFVPVKQVN